MRTILTTVGTSLLGNYRRDRRQESPTEDQLFFYLRDASPDKASAETNSLSRLLQGGDRIVLLHSQTEEGRLCVQALRRHYESQGFSAEAQEVSDLMYRESRFKMRGLRALVATLINLIREERRNEREVLINATGGFKAEIAYATVVGLLFDVPVYYIHEAFGDIIEMPPMPIGWDYSLPADHEEFFEWIVEADRTTAEADARLQGLSPEVRLLLAEEGGVTQLSPAGYAFYEAFEDRIRAGASVQVWLSSVAARTYGAAEPAVRTLWNRTFRKLRVRQLWITHAEWMENGDCLVYPKGSRVERVFFCDAEGGGVRVLELARHSDQSYERLRARGIRRSDYEGFVPWEG
jgi:putative CRISPR-associated protein (TIGR02619 family)